MSLEEKMRKARPQDIAAYYGYKLEPQKEDEKKEV